MNIGNAIKALFGVAGALLPMLIGIAGTEYWERRALGQPNWANVHVLWFKWAPPEGLAAQRDDARAQLKVAQTNVATVSRAIKVQNAAVQAQAALGVKALAQAETAVTRYRSAALLAASRVRIIQAPLVGDTMCERVKDADARFLETLR